MIGGRVPVLLTVSEKEGAGHRQRSGLLNRHPVKSQHAPKRSLHIAAEFGLRPKLANGRRAQDRSFWVESTSIGQRKQPLDVVVSAFWFVVRSSQNLAKKSATVVGANAGIETREAGSIIPHDCPPKSQLCRQHGPAVLETRNYR